MQLAKSDICWYKYLMFIILLRLLHLIYFCFVLLSLILHKTVNNWYCFKHIQNAFISIKKKPSYVTKKLTILNVNIKQLIIMLLLNSKNNLKWGKHVREIVVFFSITYLMLLFEEIITYSSLNPSWSTHLNNCF